MKFIEFRVYIKETDIERIDELAEAIKDNLYDYDEDLTPISDITYEIKEDKSK